MVDPTEHALLVPFADFFLVTTEVIIGSFVTMGPHHWGKVRFDNQFAPFRRLFAYFVFDIVLWIVTINLLDSPFADYIGGNLTFLPTGIFFQLGNLLAWFIYAFDYSFTTYTAKNPIPKFGWVFLCYTIAMLAWIIAAKG